MPEKDAHSFHEFSLKSGLFKGRPDLYFCYLKSEKVAHALAHLLRDIGPEENSVAGNLARSSAYLPSSIARFAAGEFEEASVLVDLYELLSLTRLAVSHEILSEANAKLLAEAYEAIAEKISLGKNVSPFLSLEDLAVPSLAAEGKSLLPMASGRTPVKDIKGHHKGHTSGAANIVQEERSAQILKIVSDNKRVSIKDISKVIRDCSEKTIQRELMALIEQGLIRKEGERRWSVYVPARSEPYGPDVKNS